MPATARHCAENLAVDGERACAVEVNHLRQSATDIAAGYHPDRRDIHESACVPRFGMIVSGMCGIVSTFCGIGCPLCGISMFLRV